MIEVLVSLTIIVFGLLGLVGLQAQAQMAEFESYQRGQALLLLGDIMDRIQFNRATDASGYVVGWKCYSTAALTPQNLGTGFGATPACADATILGAWKTRADEDLDAWHKQLLGASEVSAAGNKVGGLLGARGCIVPDTTTGAITISVAWQGMSAMASSANTCGQGAGNYGSSDGMRRVVSAQMIIPVLTGVAP